MSYRQPLSDDEFRWFSEWLSEEYGIRFGPEKRDILRSRLEPRRVALGFDTFEQLFFHLKYHPERQAERARLIPHLTNNESYFFRESGQLEILRREVLTAVRERLEKGVRRELRIVSAGCASGEEPYTLAMVARESPLPSPWKVRITGLDLDPEALERAKAARYTANAFRRVEPDIRSRFFDEVEPDLWSVQPDLREMVSFQNTNLVDPGGIQGLPRQDVIFCRNVLIYFGDETVQGVVDRLYQLLEPGGYLFLGHAETLSRYATRFQPIRRPGAIYYQRPENDET